MLVTPFKFERMLFTIKILTGKCLLTCLLFQFYTVETDKSLVPGTEYLVDLELSGNLDTISYSQLFYSGELILWQYNTMMFVDLNTIISCDWHLKFVLYRYQK